MYNKHVTTVFATIYILSTDADIFPIFQQPIIYK